RGIGPRANKRGRGLSTWRADGTLCQHRSMDCWAGGLKAVVVMAFRFHLHHRFHGPAIDYRGLALAAFASWSVIPGPGEPVLIAAAIYAAKHGLDITSVIAVAWVAAALGG